MTLFDNTVVIGEARSQDLLNRLGSVLGVGTVMSDPAPAPGSATVMLMGTTDTVSIIVPTELWQTANLTVPGRALPTPLPGLALGQVAVPLTQLYAGDSVLVVNAGDPAIQPWYYLQLLSRSELAIDIEGRWT